MFLKREDIGGRSQPFLRFGQDVLAFCFSNFVLVMIHYFHILRSQP